MKATMLALVERSTGVLLAATTYPFATRQIHPGIGAAEVFAA